MPATHITAFEVPHQADEPFVAGWEGQGILHRALRRDVRLRFVDVAQVETPHEPALLPYPSHHGVYGTAREDGAPDGREGVVLICAFEVPEGEDELFLAGWDRTREALAARPGSLGARLHRSLAPADFRFVEIGRWSSPLAFARALRQPDVERAAAAMTHPAHPALYLIVSG